jgi:hypothetical protein
MQLLRGFKFMQRPPATQDLQTKAQKYSKHGTKSWMPWSHVRCLFFQFLDLFLFRCCVTGSQMHVRGPGASSYDFFVLGTAGDTCCGRKAMHMLGLQPSQKQQHAEAVLIAARLLVCAFVQAQCLLPGNRPGNSTNESMPTNASFNASTY